MELSRLQAILEQHCRLQRGLPLLAGISGGPDSTCLLDVLDLLGYAPLVAHFDHHLRPESGEEAEGVRSMAKERGLTYIGGGGDVAGLAHSQRLSLEEAARLARYRFLFEQARLYSAQAVAVAHSADDQVETVLMHLLRGAGLGGLKGMTYRSLLTEWDASIPLVRPLLGTWRCEVEEYCTQRRLPTFQDPSNADQRFYRNRLRHELIPFLETYNPRLKQALWRSADTLAADHALLTDILAEAWKRTCRTEGESIALDLEMLRTCPPGVQRSLLRAALGKLLPSLRNIGYTEIERALAFVAKPSRSGGMDWTANLCLYIEGNCLWVQPAGTLRPEPAWLQLTTSEPQELTIPGQVMLAQGWRITASIQAYDPSHPFPTDPLQAWLDADQLTLPLVLRKCHPGDRFQPLGMDGHSLKLADFWTNNALPRQARPAWLLVFSGEEIAWLPGFRPAHFCRIQASTSRLVSLKVSR
jgi:tRNA(Ile)-lysidine synthase